MMRLMRFSGVLTIPWYGMLLFLFMAGAIRSVAQNLVRSNFDKSTLTYELTFKNDYNYPIYITKVGGMVKADFGDFSCQAQHPLPNPFTDYKVMLNPLRDTVLINTDPIIKIAPDETATFTLAVIPDVRKACDIWAVNISFLVRFHYGYRYASSPEMITNEDLGKAVLRSFTDQELQGYLNNSDVNIRIKAVEELKYSTLGPQVVETMLNNKLSDNNPLVRSATARTIADMGNRSFTDKLVSNLLTSTDRDEKITLIKVLGKLKDPKGSDILINRIMAQDLLEARIAARSLIDMQSPDIANKIRFLLQRHAAWALGTPEEKAIYEILCSIAISYKDMGSVQALRNILNDPAITGLNYSILNNLSILLDKPRAVNDNFLGSFTGDYEGFFNNKDDFARMNALNLYLATEPEVKNKVKVIKRFLKDSEFHIQCLAAIWAGELGLKEFASDVEALCNSPANNDFGEVCEAMIKLSPQRRQ